MMVLQLCKNHQLWRAFPVLWFSVDNEKRTVRYREYGTAAVDTIDVTSASISGSGNSIIAHVKED